MYHLIGKHARVQLYTREGLMLGALEGRIADVFPQTNVAVRDGEEILKDLVHLVDLDPVPGPDGEMIAYQNSAGNEGEMLAAVQDLTILDDEDTPAPSGFDLSGMSFN
jgi:hypothetical protein